MHTESSFCKENWEFVTFFPFSSWQVDSLNAEQWLFCVKSAVVNCHVWKRIDTAEYRRTGNVFVTKRLHARGGRFQVGAGRPVGLTHPWLKWQPMWPFGPAASLRIVEAVPRLLRELARWSGWWWFCCLESGRSALLRDMVRTCHTLFGFALDVGRGCWCWCCPSMSTTEQCLWREKPFHLLWCSSLPAWNTTFIIC
jgi:hypothetical protein